MASLAVNVDHVATVRQARGIDVPDPVLGAYLAELAGADGIICHLREDRRHINDRDVELLRRTVKTRLNLEMAAVEEMVTIALTIRPDLVTLVPASPFPSRRRQRSRSPVLSSAFSWIPMKTKTVGPRNAGRTLSRFTPGIMQRPTAKWKSLRLLTGSPRP